MQSRQKAGFVPQQPPSPSASAGPASGRSGMAARRGNAFMQDQLAGAATQADAHADRSAGRGLPLDLARAMRPAFGPTVDAARVHTDAEADRAATSAGAEAVTRGVDIYFRAGAFSPGSRNGDDLVAHELAHVAEGGEGGAGLSDPSSGPEQRASQVGDDVAGALQSGEDVGEAAGRAGQVGAGVGGGGGGKLWRQPAASGTPGAGSEVAGPICTPDYVAPAAVAVTGLPGYYDNRHDNFASRYADCQLTPPDYYKSYGGKYCARFTTELSPRLSADGQAWLVQAALNLQGHIEERRRGDPRGFDDLERNNGAFREFAYSTHADSYLDAGLADLDPVDLAMIGLTPDVGDLVTAPGISQAIETALRILPRWGDNLDLLTPELSTVVDAYIVGGRGTIETVTELGYELAAEEIEPAIDLVDGTFGEGTTERVLNQARELAQDGVYSISDPVRILMEESGYEWPWDG